MAETYEITGQTPRTRTEPGGVFTQVVMVSFRTKPSGVAGVIDIPAQMFSPDEVDRLVRERAALLETVQNL